MGTSGAQSFLVRLVSFYFFLLLLPPSLNSAISSAFFLIHFDGGGEKILRRDNVQPSTNDDEHLYKNVTRKEKAGNISSFRPSRRPGPVRLTS